MEPVKKLWVDDERVAPDGYDWAKTADEAKRLLTHNQYAHASLDHDLSMTNEGLSYNPDAESGSELADWMVENGKIPLSVHIHSANPSGAEYMHQALSPHTNVSVGAHSSKVANILDPVHPTLDARVWDHAGDEKPSLKPEHKKWIIKEVMQLASRFEKNPERWLKLVLTGSLTTYQYSEESDVDISLFINPHYLPEWDRARLIGLMVQHLDGVKLPGTPFPMQCFVVPKNISEVDLYQLGLRSGYDIDLGRWLVPPEKNRVHDVQREQNQDYIYALESADKMERLLRYEPDRAVMYWHQIHKRRRLDQKAGKGDFAQSNIVYKMLSNRGLFPEISQASGEYIAKAKPITIYLDSQEGSADYNARPVFYNERTATTIVGGVNRFHSDEVRENPNLFPTQSVTELERHGWKLARLTSGKEAGTVTSMQTPWGQDWQEWQDTQPSYRTNDHQLGYDPAIHSEGKGFITDQGHVWTWPTKNLRPEHMAYAQKLKAVGTPMQPGSAFHIADGEVFFYGPGRQHDQATRQIMTQADPRLRYHTPLPEEANMDDGFDWS